jgi:hypothetical protein
MSDKAIKLLGGTLAIGILVYALISSQNSESNDVYEPIRVIHKTTTRITVDDISLGMSYREVSSLLEKGSNPEDVTWKPFGQLNENVHIINMNDVEWHGIVGSLEIEFKEENNKVTRMEWSADKITQSDFNSIIKRIKNESPNSKSTSGSIYGKLAFTWKTNKQSYNLLWDEGYHTLQLITPAETINITTL